MPEHVSLSASTIRSAAARCTSRIPKPPTYHHLAKNFAQNDSQTPQSAAAIRRWSRQHNLQDSFIIRRQRSHAAYQYGHDVAQRCARSGRRLSSTKNTSPSLLNHHTKANLCQATSFNAQQVRQLHEWRKHHQHQRRQPLQPHTTTAMTKTITAFCASETYDLAIVRTLLQRHSLEHINLSQGGLDMQVIHLRPLMHTDSEPAGANEQDESQASTHGDVFIFRTGCVVAWDVPAATTAHLINTVLSGAAREPLAQHEIEDFAYIENADQRTSRIIGDTIHLGTRDANGSELVGDEEQPAHEDLQNPQHHCSSIRTSSDSTPVRQRQRNVSSVTLAKIAFSSALTRSTKLAVLEDSLASYFETTRTIASTLSASGSTLPFTRAFVLRKTGELLNIRAQLNLYSELTDSLPDLFWDAPHSLHLEDYYDSLGRALDVNIRIKVLNQKMDYASEIAAVLRERLSEKHSTGLEWLIIGLISIEVAFGLFHLVKESQEGEELRRVRHLLERYLERQMDSSA